MLRDKEKYTFKKITLILQTCGIKLQESTVREYYYQMLPTQKEECIKIMEEHATILATLKKETKGLEILSIREKVAEFMKKKPDSTLG